jgi:DNA-directed RNA polymerase alpha subunit
MITFDDNYPIEEVGLSVRSEKRLKMDYKTVGEVRAASDEELLRANNFGRVSLKEVRRVVGTSAEPALIPSQCEWEIRHHDEWKTKETARRLADKYESPWFAFCL